MKGMFGRMGSSFYQVRRNLLRSLVPEMVWPKFVKLDNADIPLRNMPFSFGVKWILRKGEYEVSERILVNKIIKKGSKVLELGGSIGILATILHYKVGASGYIISVEASERLTKHSKERLEPLGNIRILTGIGFPVWQVPDKFRNINFIDDGNSLGGMVDFNSDNSAKKEYHEVYDIKSIVDLCGVEPDILLIDIEGSEIVVLEENISIPGSVKHIVIEMHPNLYGPKQEKEIISKLVTLGFHNMEEISHVYLFSRI